MYQYANEILYLLYENRLSKQFKFIVRKGVLCYCYARTMLWTIVMQEFAIKNKKVSAEAAIHNFSKMKVKRWKNLGIKSYMVMIKAKNLEF